MILILFLKFGKFEPDDSYKLHCSKKSVYQGVRNVSFSQ